MVNKKTYKERAEELKDEKIHWLKCKEECINLEYTTALCNHRLEENKQEAKALKQEIEAEGCADCGFPEWEHNFDQILFSAPPRCENMPICWHRKFKQSKENQKALKILNEVLE